MKVETYEVEVKDQSEIQALASEGESSLLIKSLGLTGQKSLLNEKTGELVPYRHMTKQEHFVFKTLFPNQCCITDYKSGPIPLRVLQVAAHTRDLSHPDMRYLQVWYPEQGIDDPVLVARPDSWRDPVFLLARWGDALLPFPKLLEQAINKQKAKARAALLKAKRDADSLIADLDSYIEAKSADGSIPYISLCA